MFRGISILLALVVALLASGAPTYVHELQHAHEHAVAAAARQVRASTKTVLSEASARSTPQPSAPDDDHDDDSACLICAQLHAPLFMERPYAILLEATGWVRYISMLAIPQHPQTFPARTSCRGPPIFMPSYIARRCA